LDQSNYAEVRNSTVSTFREDRSLYTYVSNSALNGTDPSGNEILLQSHSVIPKANHAKVTIIPKNQGKYASDKRFKNQLPDGRKFATIGAGPSNESVTGVVAPGRLVSAPNRGRDVGQLLDKENKSSVLLTPPGGDEDAAIEALFAADANYGDNEDYEFFPSARSDGYNSNSYVSGLLRAVGFGGYARPPLAPGFGKPLPPGDFKKGVVTVEDCPDGICPP